MALYVRRAVQHNTLSGEAGSEASELERLGKRYHFLRTFEKDLELRTFRGSRGDKPLELGILCPDALTFGHFGDGAMWRLFQATSRLNMVHLVPEMSLVFVGSPTGRVMVLTLTKLRVPMERELGIWHHGFRVEYVLPRKSDEQKHRKVLRPLHGIAVGPVRDEGGGNGMMLPRRYRLMLHYRNHDIMTYEITREEQTGKLCIF